MNKDTCQLIKYDALVQDALRGTRTKLINGKLIESRKCTDKLCEKCHWNYCNQEQSNEPIKVEPKLPRFAIKFI